MSLKNERWRNVWRTLIVFDQNLDHLPSWTAMAGFFCLRPKRMKKSTRGMKISKASTHCRGREEGSFCHASFWEALLHGSRLPRKIQAELSRRSVMLSPRQHPLPLRCPVEDNSTTSQTR